MGLVFVLLLGEIDLSAGYTAGTSAAVLAVALTSWGVPWYLAVVLCLLTGAFIGLVIGLLVALLGIPSFVVTLAAFLGLQGVMLLVIGKGGTIPVRDPAILRVMNTNLPDWAGWLFWALVVAAFVAVGLLNQARRRRAGLASGNQTLFWAGAVGLAVLLGIAVFLLNLERARPNAPVSLSGVPFVVPVTVLFLVGLTFVLTRTTFGRHVYAVGGNAEAARRAGINVARVRIACFMIGSTMAAVAGILLASRTTASRPPPAGRRRCSSRGGGRDRWRVPLRRARQGAQRDPRRPGHRRHRQRPAPGDPRGRHPVRRHRSGAAARSQRRRDLAPEVPRHLATPGPCTHATPRRNPAAWHAVARSATACSGVGENPNRR
jgi:ribose/xylose/arabinose/galactoside ABC-type transport system permease subunit